jgi:carboxyl-terminal processing protease
LHKGKEDFVDVIGWRIDEVVDLIRGPKNSTVRLQILPAMPLMKIKLKSLVLYVKPLNSKNKQPKNVYSHLTRNDKPYKVGVIKLPTFYADFAAMQAGDPNYRSTTRDVARLLEELKAEKIDGLVIRFTQQWRRLLNRSQYLNWIIYRNWPYRTS